MRIKDFLYYRSLNSGTSGGGGGGGAEVTEITGITPDVGERGDISISFPADAMPCLIVVGDETTSYELTSAERPVLTVYFNLQGTWRMTQAYGIKKSTKYYVKRGSYGATGIVNFSNGIVTINNSTSFSEATTYTVEYVI